MKHNQTGPILNAYPDSLGGNLSDIVSMLNKPELKGVFQTFYILPSVFHTDLDRGFSVIDYGLNQELASMGDIEAIKNLGIELKLDFVLNHASVLSPQFQDLLKNGRNSKYADFFIDWNKFWDGCGEMTAEGYIQPDQKYIEKMFFRKPGLPLLMIRMPDGSNVPYWNTFYQEIRYPRLDAQDIMQLAGVQYGLAEKIASIVNTQLNHGITPQNLHVDGIQMNMSGIAEYLESNRKYLGQMDLNIKSPLVWEYYENTLKKLASYGTRIVRLDAFAYAPKEPGKRNFLNDPGTWELLAAIHESAKQYDVTLLPEIHASYEEKIYEQVSQKGYMTYDFFLPGLILDAMERHSGVKLAMWAEEVRSKNIKTVNMLGCHDGIPLLDLKGMLTDEEIQRLIQVVVNRGGYVKNLHGQKNVYYQVNCTYYSALGENDRKMLMARAIQMFMPGRPQIWYLDLFAGTNDYEAVKRAGEGGHKEINRTNLSAEQIENGLKKEVVQKQIELIRFRKEFPAFAENAQLLIEEKDHILNMQWEKDGYRAILHMDFDKNEFIVKGFSNQEEVFAMCQNP